MEKDLKVTKLWSTATEYVRTYLPHLLLTKLVRSRWPDIGQVLFLRVYGPRQSRGP